MFNVKIRIHGETLENALSKRIKNIAKVMHSDRVKRLAAEVYLDCVEPLVPKDSGTLRKSAHVSDKRYKGDYAVVYDAEYSKAQYEGKNGKPINKDGSKRMPASQWNRATPGTYDHWNHHMCRADRQAMYELIAEEVIKEINHG